MDTEKCTETTIVIALKKKPKSGLLNRIISSLIKMRTRSKYYHSEVIYSGSWITSDPIDGVVFRELKPLKNSWDYYSISFHASEAQVKAVDNYLSHIHGKKYDFTGIVLSQLFTLGLHSRKMYFCSEISSKMLSLFSVDGFTLDTPNMFSPGRIGAILDNLSKKKGMTHIEVRKLHRDYL